MNQDNKMDFEINLMPMISVLAVCISMLLLTSVWVSVGQLSVSQGLGTQSRDNKKSTSLMVKFLGDTKIELKVEDSEVITGSTATALFNITGRDSDFLRIGQFVDQWVQKDSGLKQAVLLPDRTTAYKDMIQVIDQLKGLGVESIGISPIL